MTLAEPDTGMLASSSNISLDRSGRLLRRGMRRSTAKPAATRATNIATVLARCKEIPYIGLMITSRLTSKAQTTIPQAVRTALRLHEGDEIAYTIEPGRVVLTRVQSDAAEDDPFRTFAEWDSTADTEAYAGL